MNYQLIQESLAGGKKLGIYKDFKKMVNRYQLIAPNDKIAVEISADKNCLLVMSCLKEFQKEEKTFDLQYFIVKKENKLTKIQEEIISAFEIQEYVELDDKKVEDVYDRMERLGCTKVALPHNYNDIVNSTFMTFMQRKQAAQIQPKRTSKHVSKLQFIRPLCIVEDAKILKWIDVIDMELVEEISLLSKLAFIEEGIVVPEKSIATQFEFNIYERI